MDLIDRQAAIDAADDMVEPQESEGISDREPYVPDINVGNKAESEDKE